MLSRQVGAGAGSATTAEDTRATQPGVPVLISINEALDAVLGAVATGGVESVPLLDALGRTLAEDVVAPDDVPPFSNSAMDGFALRVADQTGRRSLRLVAEIPAGYVFHEELPPGGVARIMTGAPLPPGADAVVEVEATTVCGEEVEIENPVERGRNVRYVGEDVRRGSILLTAGDAIEAAHLGVLASAGVARVRVARRPSVAILSTGSELVPIDQRPGPGQIRNSNSYTAYGQAREAGAAPVMLGIARDDREETREQLRRALREDVVITSGGVSVGDYDFVKAVQEELGVERRFWGVRTKPGKPLVFGVRDRTLVFGVPGNPVAAMVSFEVYIRPALLRMQGRRDVWRPWVLATSAEPVKHGSDRAELRRCRVWQTADGRWCWATTGPQGSGILSSMALADGLALVAVDHPGGPTGERMPVMLLRGAAAERPPYP